jgi:hypothetical protein
MRCCEILHRTRGPSHSGSPVTCAILPHTAAMRRPMARTGYLGGSDAAVIVARKHNFITQGIKVELAAAKSQHFGATGGQHAAHAVKRYTFDGKDIAEVYTRRGVDEVALIGLRTMLGLAIDVDRRANLSIEKRIDPVLSALHSCRGRWTPRSAALRSAEAGARSRTRSPHVRARAVAVHARRFSQAAQTIMPC